MRAARAVRRLVVAALVAVPLAVLPAAPAAAEEVYARPADGIFHFEGHGWGHGHGLNQWGAEGAARQGVTATRILDAYYPGTAQQTLPNRTIRVLIGEDDHSDLRVGAAANLAVKDVASGARYVLPTAYGAWRIVVDGGGQHVQYYSSGWHGWAVGTKTAWTGPLQFEGASVIRLFFSSGAARDYHGALRAVRTGTTTLDVVDVLDLEHYLYGVVPRESPAYFKTEALKAQAVAARSYSAYKVDHAPSGAAYDICSTTQCQVYGGVRYVSSGGTVTELEPASTTSAVNATAGVTRTYGGKAIFAEFSSSNGGWSTTGSMPYLTAHADPWDAIASPSHYWTGTVTAAQLQARYPSVGTLRRIRVTLRDGNGEWGGRVKTVVLEGVDGSGNATSVTTTGGGVYLANTWPTSSSGLRGSWWHIIPTYGAALAGQSATKTLVHSPGVAKGDLVVNYKNTGSAIWDASTVHLAVSTGGVDPMVGTSKPGVFGGNLTRSGATTVEPNEVARFVVHLDASSSEPGSYVKSYRVQIGAGSLFGPVVTWTVPVVEPVFTASLAGITGTAAAPTDGSPAPVNPNGTVLLPRGGAVSLNVRMRNTGNVAWPLHGAVRLVGSDPHMRESISTGSDWISTSQVSAAASVEGVANATAVQPGQVAVFPMTLHGNGRATGLTEETFEPVWFGYEWMGAKLRLHVVRWDPNVARHAQAAYQPPPSKLLAYPGDRTTLVLRVRNLGGTKWPVNGSDVLGTANPLDRIDALKTSTWLSATRSVRLAVNVSRPGVAYVYPGEVGEYRVPVDPTDKTAKTYGEWFRPIYGSSWYGGVLGTSVTVSAATLSASVTRNTRGIVVPRNGVATYVVELRNTGNTTWWLGANMRLMTPSPSPGRTSTWITSTRPCGITANVSYPGARRVTPGQVARFTFTIGGNGRAAGTYSETFGAGWEAWRSTGLRIPVSYVVR
jgi:SpoIID/LytB domain protein